MTTDDPRHGTEAGAAQHWRDGEDACAPCRRADLIASRRRSKRKTMGHRYTRPIGEANHAKLVRLKGSGARWRDLAEWASISPSQVWRLLDGGPETVVYARTFRRVAAMQQGRIVTPVGVTRRIQALCWLGHSPERIAAEAGVCLDTVRDARLGERVFLAAKVRDGIADAYDRMHMTLPAASDRWARAGVTRVRNHAIANGWSPPLAWDDIDDPNEQPRGMIRGSGDVDEAVVLRVLSGDNRVKATPAERAEVCRRWVTGGRSLAELERLTGWKPDRYFKVGEDAA